ncbi:MAG: hypothetical protein IKJ39_00850 [Lachnospiraceae bacterium]|nr:hypothetical protein [Lachnospiraceae bacterium]
MKNLTDDLPDKMAVDILAKEYHEHRKNTLYRSVMNVIGRANEELFKEESDMCEAIIDLFRDEYDKGVEEALQMGVQQGMLQSVENLMKSLPISLEKACVLLGSSPEDYEVLRQTLNTH